MHSTCITPNRKYVVRWLRLCLLMVALMVVVGGLTRLTESGLSMVEWKPTTFLPPLSENEWENEFQKYQQSPQYQKVNKNMDIYGFQQIFWLEYIHRLLGRATGFIFLLPFLYFLWQRSLSPSLIRYLTVILILGGCQGFLGWYMVKSGLIDQPWVSPIRLAMHLGMAFIIFGLLWWQLLKLESTLDKPLVFSFSLLPPIALLFLLYIQILLGALVAGLDAGLLFNTFPDMNGEFFPAGLFALQPWYMNLADNPTMVHFIHRLGALTVAIAIILSTVYYHYSYSTPQLQKNSYIMLAALTLQIILGAATVIYHVPITVATAHQAAALLLYAVVIRQIFLTTTQH